MPSCGRSIDTYVSGGCLNTGPSNIKKCVEDYVQRTSVVAIFKNDSATKSCLPVTTTTTLINVNCTAMVACPSNEQTPE